MLVQSLSSLWICNGKYYPSSLLSSFHVFLSKWSIQGSWSHSSLSWFYELDFLPFVLTPQSTYMHAHAPHGGTHVWNILVMHSCLLYWKITLLVSLFASNIVFVTCQKLFAIYSALCSYDRWIHYSKVLLNMFYICSFWSVTPKINWLSVRAWLCSVKCAFFERIVINVACGARRDRYSEVIIAVGVYQLMTATTWLAGSQLRQLLQQLQLCCVLVWLFAFVSLN